MPECRNCRITIYASSRVSCQIHGQCGIDDRFASRDWIEMICNVILRKTRPVRNVPLILNVYLRITGVIGASPPIPVIRTVISPAVETASNCSILNQRSIQTVLNLYDSAEYKKVLTDNWVGRNAAVPRLMGSSIILILANWSLLRQGSLNHPGRVRQQTDPRSYPSPGGRIDPGWRMGYSS